MTTPGLCSGAEVVHAPAFGQTFKLTFNMLVPPGGEGYVFTQSTAGISATTVASLFVRGDGSGLEFAHRISGVDAVVSWDTAAAAAGGVPPGTTPEPLPVLADNAFHTVELAVDGRAGHLRASLTIDGIGIGTKTLAGVINGCGVASPCQTRVLQGLDGCIFEAAAAVTV